MHYGEIKNCDIANGEGVRISLFVSGCTNHCENCFQPQTWDFNYGTPFTKETEDELLRLLAPDYINGLTLLGGEPFEPDNQRALLPFLHRVRPRTAAKEHLVVHRLYLGRAAYARLLSPLRGDRRASLPARRSGGRPLRGSAARHFAALPRLIESAHHRRSENARVRHADALGRKDKRLEKTPSGLPDGVFYSIALKRINAFTTPSRMPAMT